MLLNCSKCQSLTVDVNKASGLELHRLLDADHEIGSINGDWNYLVNKFKIIYKEWILL